MRKIYLIILLILSSFNFLEAQDSYVIKGKIYGKVYERDLLLVGAIISANRDSTITETASGLDGTFELKLDYKPKTINIEHNSMDLVAKKIETNFDDKNEMILDTFLEQKKLELVWEKESVEYNSELTGKWFVKKITSNNKKRCKIPTKLKSKYFFIFDTEEYDSLKYDTFTFSKGCYGAVEIYYRFTDTDELEFRRKPIRTQASLIDCVHAKMKHRKLHYEYRSICRSMIDNIANYKLDNGKLYIRSENNQFILQKYIKPTVPHTRRS